MTQKERLTELIEKGGDIATEKILDEARQILKEKHRYDSAKDRLVPRQELVADYLLNNGVIVLPCKVGDTVYTNMAMSGRYLRKKDRPYACKVVLIELNASKEYGGGFINIEYPNGYMWEFHFSHIGKTVFLTKSEAEKALRKCEEK